MSPWKAALPALIIGPLTYCLTVGILYLARTINHAMRKYRVSKEAKEAVR